MDEERDPEDRGDGWQEVVTVSRSYIDSKVWVPYDHDLDMTCFMRAGGIRAVKRWAEKTWAGDRQLRWVRVSDEVWELHVREQVEG